MPLLVPGNSRRCLFRLLLLRLLLLLFLLSAQRAVLLGRAHVHACPVFCKTAHPPPRCFPPCPLSLNLACPPKDCLRPAAETVPFRVIAWFTAFQTAYLLLVYGVTWAGVAG